MSLLRNVYSAQYEDGRSAEVQVVIKRTINENVPCVEVDINQEDVTIESRIIRYATDEVADQGFRSLKDDIEFLCDGMLPDSEKLINFQLIYNHALDYGK